LQMTGAALNQMPAVDIGSINFVITKSRVQGQRRPLVHGYGKQFIAGLGVAVAIFIPAVKGGGDRAIRQCQQLAGGQCYHTFGIGLVGFTVDLQGVGAFNVEAQIVLRLLIVERHVTADIHFGVDRNKTGVDIQLMRDVDVVFGPVDRPGADFPNVDKGVHIRCRDHHLPVSIIAYGGGIIFLVGTRDHQAMARHDGGERAAQ